jgi:hypothetical protein
MVSRRTNAQTFPISLAAETRDHVAALAEVHRTSISEVVQAFLENGLDAPDAVPDILPNAASAPLLETSAYVEASVVKRVEDLAWSKRKRVRTLARYFIELGCAAHPVPPEVIEWHRAVRLRRVEEMGIEPTTSASSPSTLAALRRTPAAVAAEVEPDAIGVPETEPVRADRSAALTAGPARVARSSRARAPHPHGVRTDRRSKSRVS